MFSNSYLKPFILHENKLVRTEVVNYFEDFKSQDEELLSLILEARDRYGYEDNVFPLALASKFVVTEKNFLNVIERLKTEKSKKEIVHLNAILESAPVEFFVKHNDLMRNAKYIHSNVLEGFEEKKSLYENTPEALYQELWQYSGECDNNDDVNYYYVNDVLEFLAKNEYPDEEKLCEILKSEDMFDSHMEIFMVKLAGMRRIKRAVPILVHKYEVDAEILNQYTIDALAEIGDPLAIQLIQQQYPRQEWEYRLTVSDFLGKLKCEESESACLQFLEYEEETNIRTFLCSSLCKLFSERGMNAVRDEIMRGYDYSITDLEENLITVSEVTGVDFPEKQQWINETKERRQKHKEFSREQFADFFNFLDELFDEDMDEDDDEFYDDSMVEYFNPLEITKKPQQNKIGRNEPCPCGSGKKYKKCCGR